MSLAPLSPALAYTLSGPTDAEALVFVNGLGGAQAAFSYQVRHFSHTHRVLTYDHRGMGGSELVDSETSMLDYARDLARLLDWLEIDLASFVGISFGGRVLQEFALGWPGRIDRMVLSGTSAGGRLHTSGRVDLRETLRRANSLPVEEWAAEIGSALFGGDYVRRNPNRILALARWRKRHPARPEGVARQWEAFAKFDVSTRLSAIACPVLVVHGTDDRLSPMQNANWLVQHIPDAELVRMEGIGHSPNIERPELYNQIIEGFLSSDRAP